MTYVLQIQLLPRPDRDAFIVAPPPVSRPVTRNASTRMLLMMAAGLFAHKAWLHSIERPNPGGFLGQVARDDMLLDHAHF